MGELPEGRQPLTWKDMEFASAPKKHPSTWEAEAKALRAENARLRSALEFYRNQHRIAAKPTIDAEWAQARLKADAGARAAAALGDDQ